VLPLRALPLPSCSRRPFAAFPAAPCHRERRSGLAARDDLCVAVGGVAVAVLPFVVFKALHIGVRCLVTDPERAEGAPRRRAKHRAVYTVAAAVWSVIAVRRLAERAPRRPRPLPLPCAVYMSYRSYTTYPSSPWVVSGRRHPRGGLRSPAETSQWPPRHRAFVAGAFASRPAPSAGNAPRRPLLASPACAVPLCRREAARQT
jgi:hypothetical protein